MALGAIAAIEAAGKVAGKDILVVSIDGEKDAVQAIIDGKMGATCECSPRFGPKAFDIMYQYGNGENDSRRSSSTRTASSTPPTPKRCWPPRSNCAQIDPYPTEASPARFECGREGPRRGLCAADRWKL